MGAFATLKKRGQLRGCIGLIEGRKPLHETVEEMAQAAAFKDTRFRQVTEDELDGLDIEISALTPLRQIENVNEIEVGRHGIYIVRGYHSGLLLPQVATEYNWDSDTFLSQTCVKAGLPENAWKDTDTKIFIFPQACLVKTDTLIKNQLVWTGPFSSSYRISERRKMLRLKRDSFAGLISPPCYFLFFS